MYIVHFFDEHDHARGAARLNIRDDADVPAAASRLGHAHAYEIWNGDRFVVRLYPGAVESQVSASDCPAIGMDVDEAPAQPAF